MIAADPLPETAQRQDVWKWRQRNGAPLRPAEMATSHLFFTVRMIWNNVSQPTRRVGENIKLYSFGSAYTDAYLRAAYRILRAELSSRRPLEAWQRSELAKMGTTLPPILSRSHLRPYSLDTFLTLWDDLDDDRW